MLVREVQEPRYLRGERKNNNCIKIFDTVLLASEGVDGSADGNLSIAGAFTTKKTSITGRRRLSEGEAAACFLPDFASLSY